VARLELTMACGPYDRMQALADGSVQPEGIALRTIAIQSPPEIFARMIKTGSFDIAEMSSVHYLTMRSQGRFPFVALPVFPSRLFRHGYIFVNKRAQIAEPKQLEGKRVGIQEYRMSAALWIRGMLADEHGVDWRRFDWYEGGVNNPRPPDETMDLRPLGPISLRLIASDRHLSGMLAAGEIDAYIGSRKPDSLRTSTDVIRLFPDYRRRERDYWLKTGIFPIMHTLVIREDLYERHPWIAASLYRACQDSKRAALARLRDAETMPYTLPFLAEAAEEIDQLFAGDPWAYGLAANRKSLDALGRYLFEQGFVPAPIAIESLFAPVGE
jgi:4,5-dihydroxyphthalate decarboxylase